LASAPVAFACWLSPLFGLLWAATGWFVPKASEAEQQRWQDLGESVMDETEITADGKIIDPNQAPA
jgi:NhaC family Na+:H+ antiporter